MLDVYYFNGQPEVPPFQEMAPQATTEDPLPGANNTSRQKAVAQIPEDFSRRFVNNYMDDIRGQGPRIQLS